MKKIGFVVNPVAGMGGAVALKGTDGMHERAVQLGAVPVSPGKAREFLEQLKPKDILFVPAGGDMGEDYLIEAGIENFSVTCRPGTETTADDTKTACGLMIEEGVSLIVFVGGDGTARDVASAVRGRVPILGIPSGVKMFSGVFAISASAGAVVVRNLEKAEISDTEILDIDEEDYRRGELRATLFATAPSPYLPGKKQDSKWTAGAGDDRRASNEIGTFLAGIMRDDTLYFVGAGSTANSVCEALELDYTLLGIDAIFEKKIVGKDLSEKEILSLMNRHRKVKIIISPIGAQGFVLGRGNQQFSAEVIRKAGPGNVIIAATPAKLERTPRLYVDTGERELNEAFGNSVQVICGMAIAQRVKIASAD